MRQGGKDWLESVRGGGDVGRCGACNRDANSITASSP